MGLRPSERVLDIGSGPGMLACEMAAVVAPRGSVHGVDISPSMLAVARERPPPPGAQQPHYAEGNALAMRFADARHSRDPERMRRVLAAWEAHLVHPDLPRRLTGLLEDAGFVVRDRSVVTILNAGYDTETFSAGQIDVVGTYVAQHGLTREEVDAWALDLTTLGRDYFFSLCRYLFLAVA